MSVPSADLSDFPFFFSFLAAGVVLFGIGTAMLTFVDRVLSLVILYIAAPISISTSMLDEGARFKLWRDQFLTKFIMGYGMILAINIYALVCGLVMDPAFTFFSGEGVGFLNFILKLLIIGGGALTMQKSMALIGNLVSQGAGSNELRDNALSMGSLARMATGVAGKALRAASLPLKPFGSILGNAYGAQTRHLGNKLLRGIGLEGGYEKKDKNKKDANGDSDSKNNEKADYGKNGNTKDAIEGKPFKRSFDNVNNSQAGPKKSNSLNNIINNDDKGKKQGNNAPNTSNGPKQQEGENNK
jgi:hypothetical protein